MLTVGLTETFLKSLKTMVKVVTVQMKSFFLITSSIMNLSFFFGDRCLGTRMLTKMSRYLGTSIQRQ